MADFTFAKFCLGAYVVLSLVAAYGFAIFVLCHKTPRDRR